MLCSIDVAMHYWNVADITNSTYYNVIYSEIVALMQLTMMQNNTNALTFHWNIKFNFQKLYVKITVLLYSPT